jgi:uncharacterized protein
MKIVIDTNVVLSAILFGGKPRLVLESALSSRVRMFVSEPMIAELQRVLRRPKFGFGAELVQTIVSEVAAAAEWVEPDPADNRFLECAAAAQADYLVTGDKHLLKVGVYGSARIVTADAFMTFLAKDRRR